MNETTFNRIRVNGKTTRLYYHRTAGGAEYLTDKFVKCPNGEREGRIKGATVVVRIDGGELEIICLGGAA